MKKAKNIFFFVFLTLVLNFSVVDKIALAQAGSWSGQIGMEKVGTAFGETKETEDIRFKVVRIINLALTFLGVICVVLIVFAGFKWMLAAGNDDQIKSAKKILVNTLIGLLIILVSWSVSLFIMLRLNAIEKGDPNYLDPYYPGQSR